MNTIKFYFRIATKTSKNYLPQNVKLFSQFSKILRNTEIIYYFWFTETMRKKIFFSDDITNSINFSLF